MNFLVLLLLTTILHQEAAGALYMKTNPGVARQRIYPGFKSCKCKTNESSKHVRIKRFDFITESSPEMQHPFAAQVPNFAEVENDAPETADVMNENPNTEVIENEDGTNSEVVGLGGLLRLHALGTRTRLRTATARARAHLRHPLLLQETPKQFLDNNTDQEPLKIKPTSHGNSEVPYHNYDVVQQLTKNDQRGKLKSARSNVDTLRTHQVSESSGIYPESSQYEQTFPTVPVASYNQELESQSQIPQIYAHNIETGDEGCQNRKPIFSIIPSNWKPPLGSNLYQQGVYQQQDYNEPTFTVLPGQWKDGDDYDTYYNDYDVTPVSYNIPEDSYQSYYGRSADSGQNPKDAIPQQFASVKQDLHKWENNPRVWRPTSDQSTDAKQRAADPHFHHDHSHTHSFVHHILNHGKPTKHFASPSHETTFQHSGFSNHHDEPPPFESYGHDGYNEHFGFSQSQDKFKPQISHSAGHFAEQQSSQSHGIHGHQLTINKQHTTVIVPPGSNQKFQIAQVAGEGNAVSQGQNANRIQPHTLLNGGFLPATTQNSQSAQVSGNHNSVSQSQNSNDAPFVSSPPAPDEIVGAPFIIFAPKRRNFAFRDAVAYDDIDDYDIDVMISKRSIDSNYKNSKPRHSYTSNQNTFNLLDKERDFLKQVLRKSKGDNHLGFHSINDFKPKSTTAVRNKRAAPLMRLMVDPNAKVDVPRTLENLGTVTRSSFENERRPAYHLKNAVGSTRDAFISTLRIPTQDLFIPSKYKIVDKESLNVVQASNPVYPDCQGMNQNLRAINPTLFSPARKSNSLQNVNQSKENPTDGPKQDNVIVPGTITEPEDPYNSENTHKKVGSMLRQSVRSGQDTLRHLGEASHSTRKAFATSRHVAPRVLLSSLRIPAVERQSAPVPRNEKVVILTPKVVQLQQEAVGVPRYSENDYNFVGVGHLMDSLALSNPNANPVEFRRTVLRPINLPPARARTRQPSKPMIPNLKSRSNFNDSKWKPSLRKVLPEKKRKKYLVLTDTVQAKAPKQYFQETVDVLDNAQAVVGARNLNDFILQMKTTFKQQREKAQSRKNRFNTRLASRWENGNNAKSEDEVLSQARQNPGKFRPELRSSDAHPLDTIDALDLAISLASNLTNDLKNAMDFGQPPEEPIDVEHFQEEEEIINFLINMFNSQSKTSNTPQPGSTENDNGIEDNIVGAGLPLPQQLLKPFMGQPSRNQLRRFFQENGDSVEEGDENQSEDQNDYQRPESSAQMPNGFSRNGQEVIGAINPELFKKYCVENADPENSSKCQGASSTSSNEVRPSKKIHKKVSDQHKNNEVVKNSLSTGEGNQTESVGISMQMDDALLTPFMGKLVKEEVYPGYYGNQYGNYNDEYGYRNAANENHLPSGSSGVEAADISKRQGTATQPNNRHGVLDNKPI